MTTQLKPEKPSEFYQRWLLNGHTRERAMHEVLLAYLDERHAAGQGDDSLWRECARCGAYYPAATSCSNHDAPVAAPPAQPATTPECAECAGKMEVSYPSGSVHDSRYLLPCKSCQRKWWARNEGKTVMTCDKWEPEYAGQANDQCPDCRSPGAACVCAPPAQPVAKHVPGCALTPTHKGECRVIEGHYLVPPAQPVAAEPALRYAVSAFFDCINRRVDVAYCSAAEKARATADYLEAIDGVQFAQVRDMETAEPAGPW